jgi:hypothetical protein
MNKPTPAQVRDNHESAFPDSLFFSRDSMRFAGDTMANFAVAADPVEFVTHSGDAVTCWQLYRKRTTAKGFSGAFYFNCETWKREHRPAS